MWLLEITQVTNTLSQYHIHCKHLINTFFYLGHSNSFCLLSVYIMLSTRARLYCIDKEKVTMASVKISQNLLETLTCYWSLRWYCATHLKNSHYLCRIVFGALWTLACFTLGQLCAVLPHFTEETTGSVKFIQLAQRHEA